MKNAKELNAMAMEFQMRRQAEIKEAAEEVAEALVKECEMSARAGKLCVTLDWNNTSSEIRFYAKSILEQAGFTLNEFKSQNSIQIGW